MKVGNIFKVPLDDHMLISLTASLCFNCCAVVTTQEHVLVLQNFTLGYLRVMKNCVCNLFLKFMIISKCKIGVNGV